MFRILLPLLVSADYSYLRAADYTPGVQGTISLGTYNLIKVVAASQSCYVTLLESGELRCSGSCTSR